MSHTLQDLTERLLNAAKKSGADDADAMAIQGQSLSINVRGGQLEQAERAEGIDIGLRVLIGQRQASVSASDINASTISEMAERAVAMANEAPIDPYIGLADSDALAQSWDIAALELCDQRRNPHLTLFKMMPSRPSRRRWAQPAFLRSSPPRLATATMQYTLPPAMALPAATHALAVRYLVWPWPAPAAKWNPTTMQTAEYFRVICARLPK